MTAKVPVMDLVVRLDGSIQETNLAEFETSALSVIENIKTELVTDDDFASAEQNVKDCKTIEDRIANAKQGALHSIEDISALFTTMDKLQEKFRSVRLDLNKKVKDEKQRRKFEIVDVGKRFVKSALSGSPVFARHDINFTDFDEAVKGKRSLQAMEEAVLEVRDRMMDELCDTCLRYIENMETILAVDSEYQTLFHDRKDLAMCNVEVVEASIQSRINEHKLRLAEKAEADRKAKEEADLKAAEEKPEPQPEVAPPPEPEIDFPVPESKVELPTPPPANTPCTITCMAPNQTIADQATTFLRSIGCFEIEVA